jgi:hypothetical protein
VLEEIRFSKISIKNKGSRKSLEITQDNRAKTEPSTDFDKQVFDKTDLDYYFLEKLEQIRDNGVKDEEYNLIEQEEKFSLERADQSDEDLGYLSDFSNQDSQDFKTYIFLIC